MPHSNKDVLEQANAAIVKGDNEGFLSFCTEDTTWNFIGDKTLSGKAAVRAWMEIDYVAPPHFRVERMIEEDDYVVAMGEILVKDEDGNESWHQYCDVWKFRDGKMAELNAFVLKPASSPRLP